jgi:type II secretory pathway pseudopilin PulG
MIVVMGIIVLIILIAIPSIRALTGSRSIDAGYNTLSALITQAREDAVGLQDVRGVMFYLDTSTGRVAAAIVEDTSPPTTLPTNAPTYYLDVVPNVDYIELPPGIGVQTLNNWGSLSASVSATRSTDEYIGLNPISSTFPTTDGIKYGGVILFDGNGRLISKTYGFKLFDNTTGKATNLANLFTVTTAPTTDFVPSYNNGILLSSQFGFVLFDRDAFNSQSFTDGDPYLDPNVPASYGTASTPAASPPTEADEEAWLDANATPILINRYNGTLIRAE